MKFKYIFFSVLLFSLTSCETDVEDPTAVVPPAPSAAIAKLSAEQLVAGVMGNSACTEASTFTTYHS